MIIRINHKERRTKVLTLSIYILSIVVAYILVLSPLYSYAHLTTDVNYYKLGISIVLLIIAVCFLPSDTKKPSTYLYYILFAVIYIPTVTYYWLNNQPTIYIVYETCCFILIALLIKKEFNPIRIKTSIGNALIKILLVIYILLCIYLILQNGGIHLSSIITDLYMVRSANSISGFTGYILNWCAKSFMPLFFVYFFIKKQWLGVVLVSVLQIGLFLSFGFKAFIMAVVMLIGISWLMRKPDNFKRNWVIILSVGNAISLGVSYLGSYMLLNLFTYRTLMLPAQGQFEYYDFFTHNKFLFFSEGTIGRVFGIDYPYSQSIGHIVNSYIYGPSRVSNGNTGAFSYGFADIGFLGMILAAVVIVLVLCIVDSSTKDMPIMIPVCSMAYQMFVLNDNNILISLNTGGIFWTIVLLILLNSVYSKIAVRKLKEDYNCKEYSSGFSTT